MPASTGVLLQHWLHRDLDTVELIGRQHAAGGRALAGHEMIENGSLDSPPAPGLQGVDWEVRVDFERLRQHRLARVRGALEASELGAVLLFETSNIRYATSTQIGYWAFNKGERYALITRTGRPRIWDFGSAAKAHRLQLPHLYDETNSVGGNVGLQGAIAPTVGTPAPGRAKSCARCSPRMAWPICRSASTSPRHRCSSPSPTSASRSATRSR